MNAWKTVNARHLALYPRDCVCEVETPLGKGGFDLVALYLNGARLRAQENVPRGILVPGIEAQLNLALTLRGLYSGPFPCMVRDVDGGDSFLAFGNPLRFSFLGTMRDNPRHFA